VGENAGSSGKFYDTKLKVARFYIDQILPETESLLTTIASGRDALAEFEVADFED
jgi:hypothetical protein